MYKENLRKAQEELKIQKQRLVDIKDLISDLSRDFDDYASDITGYTRKTSGKISDGIKGSRNMSQRSYDVEKEREQDPSTDTKLSTANSNLLREKTTVENKIAELQNRISSLTVQIANTEAAIRAEERRLEEERRAEERRAEERRRESSERQSSKAASR
jgi:predicted  nucleic acid-binding Zn-ribbon protein